MNGSGLAGRAALAPGAASGIGLTTAVMLPRQSAAVALNFLPGDGRGPEVAVRLEA